MRHHDRLTRRKGWAARASRSLPHAQKAARPPGVSHRRHPDIPQPSWNTPIAALSLVMASQAARNAPEAICTRRSSLVLLASTPTLLTSQMRTHAAEAKPSNAQVLYVTPSSPSPQAQAPSDTFTSITAALSALRKAREAGLTAPAAILVSEGSYRERIVLEPGIGPLHIRPVAQGAAVQVVWETQEPYQSVVDCSAPSVILSHITLRHASKSVANNYAVYIHSGSDLTLDTCDVSSVTGSGVGVEDATPTIRHCRLHDCALHGVAVFGPLDSLSDSRTGGAIESCEAFGNGGDGVLVRGGAAPCVSKCVIHDNRGWGVAIQSSGGHYKQNRVERNGKGALQVLDCPLETDPTDWVRGNTLQGTITLTG